MTAPIRATLLTAALALAAPALADDPRPATTAAPPAVAGPGATPAPRLEGPLDLRARVRSIPGGLSLEVGGTVVELRFTDGAAAVPEPPPPGNAHELRATFSLDGQTRGVVLRVVPSPEQGGAPATP